MFLHIWSAMHDRGISILGQPPGGKHRVAQSLSSRIRNYFFPEKAGRMLFIHLIFKYSGESHKTDRGIVFPSQPVESDGCAMERC